jgi:6-phosphogluconolactonase
MNRNLVALAVAGCLGLVGQQGSASELVYIGTHGTPGHEAHDPQAPQGIYAAYLDSTTGRLTPLGPQVELDRATWLLVPRERSDLYSVADSNINSYTIDPASGHLTPRSKTGSGGRDATYLGFDKSSRSLFVANHGSGDVTVLPVNPDGSLGSVISSQKQYGTGPHRRQNMPEPHGIAVDPSHAYLLATDFGADRIFIYHFDGWNHALSPAQPSYVATPPGSGPRHILFDPHGKFVYVNTELSAELFVYRWDERQGHLRLVQTVSGYPAQYSGGEKSSAEIAMSHDGRYLYLSLRGDQDSIVVYAVSARDGTLVEIQRTSALGKTPWSFGIDPSGRWLLVTNEASNSVNVLSIDPRTGELNPTQESLTIPQPVTVAFYGSETTLSSEWAVGHANQLARVAVPPRSQLPLTVTSPSFKDGGDIPRRNTQYGGNIFPGLGWSKGPEETKSYVVIVQGDPVTGSTTSIHLTLFNVPANVTQLDAGMTNTPNGATYGPNVHGLNQPYAGPHPHTAARQRYHLQVFALDTTLDSDPHLAFAALESAMTGHVLASGELVGVAAGDPPAAH